MHLNFKIKNTTYHLSFKFVLIFGGIICNILFMNLGNAYSQGVITRLEEDVQSGTITELQFAVNAGYAYLFPERLPAEYQTGEELKGKCGFGTKSRIRAQLPFMSPDVRSDFEQLFARIPDSSLPEEYVSANGGFRIHFTNTGSSAVPQEDVNTNGIPDYVEETADAFEYSHDLLVNQMGYPAPPNDFNVDGPEYDVFIFDLGNGSYGETNFDTRVGLGWTSHIGFDNDFVGDKYYSSGIDAVKVTAAHEYFHSIQAGQLLRFNDIYFYEISSTWFEDIAYPEVNDYLGYLPLLLKNLNQPFTSTSSNHQYGMSIYLHFLSKKYDNSLIKQIWDNMLSENTAIDAIDKALISKDGSSFDLALPEFYYWNYFTGTRADSVQFYTDAKQFPEVIFTDSLFAESDTTVSYVKSFNNLSGQYFQLSHPQGADYNAKMRLFDSPASWSGIGFTTVRNKASGFERLNFLPDSTLDISISASGFDTKFVVVPVVTARTFKPGDINYTIVVDMGLATNLPVEVSALLPTNPSPVNFNEVSIVNIPFVLLEQNEVEIKIFTTTGRLVKSFDPMEKGKGLHELPWNGLDNSGTRVPSGVYIYIMTGKNIREMKKMAIIR